MNLGGIKLYNNLHNKNHEKAKFKLNEKVLIHKKDYPEIDGKVCEVIALEYTEDDEQGNPIFEYLVCGFQFLLWEYELEKI